MQIFLCLLSSQMKTENVLVLLNSSKDMTLVVFDQLFSKKLFNKEGVQFAVQPISFKLHNNK